MKIAHSGHVVAIGVLEDFRVAESGRDQVILWYTTSTETKLSWIEFLFYAKFIFILLSQVVY